jgi:hypothetical protein
MPKYSMLEKKRLLLALSSSTITFVSILVTTWIWILIFFDELIVMAKIVAKNNKEKIIMQASFSSIT